MYFITFLALTLQVFSSVSSHVTANPRELAENSYVQTNLRVPHGCGSSATVKVIIDMDKEVVKAGGSFTPQLVGGWKLSLVTPPTSNDTSNTGGAQVSEAGSAETILSVIYSDNELPHNVYADFGITFKAPKIADLPKERNGTLIFPTYQLCKNGQWQNWTTVGDSKFPPPVISLTTTNSVNSTTAGAKKSSAQFNYNLAPLATLLVSLSLFWI